MLLLMLTEQYVLHKLVTTDHGGNMTMLQSVNSFLQLLVPLLPTTTQTKLLLLTHLGLSVEPSQPSTSAQPE